jgi:hypothetical protein
MFSCPLQDIYPSPKYPIFLALNFDKYLSLYRYSFNRQKSKETLLENIYTIGRFKDIISIEWSKSGTFYK